jgi:hypothetical protein
LKIEANKVKNMSEKEINTAMIKKPNTGFLERQIHKHLVRLIKGMKNKGKNI